jgi:protein-tyrosine-phosphatase
VDQVLLFVCPHGAAKSRMAAAFFNQIAPLGWTAISAGMEPAAELSPTAVRLLAGTDAETFLDHAPPRTISSAERANRVVGIDCAPAGATDHWELGYQELNAEMRDAIRARAEALAAELERG